MKSNILTKGLLLFSACTLLFFTACTDLEVEGTDSVILEPNEDGFTAGDPTQLLEAALNDLSAFTDQANIYSLSQHTSDEMIPPTRGVDWGDNGVWRTLHQHTWDPTHAYVLGAWNQLNERAFKTNQILASNPSAEQEAQARWLRAFYVYQVADLFGVVPFREVDEGVDVDPRVFSRTEAIDFAISDLEAALPNLPGDGPSNSNFGPNKAAAHLLLSRIYLNRAVYNSTDPAGPYTHDSGDMQKVIDNVDAIAQYGYSLEDEYFKIYTKNAESEIILVSNQGSGENRWMMTLHYSQNPSGWNGFTSLASFYDKFDENDPRIGNYPTPDGSEFSGIGRGFLIGQQYSDDGSVLVDERTKLDLQFTRDVPIAGAATAKGIRAIKYHPSDHGPYRIMRYGEAYVNKAEAQFRSGDTDGAIATLNELRAARGAPSISSLTEESLLDERGFETYWEGIRRTDQVRFGTFNTTWEEKTITDPTRVLFPIPQQALDSNPNLTQNAGY
ncbi:MAG: RagB/SusD family nutrient uptake outer membrane protein [Saprospiraceae bacterium]